MRGCPSMMDAVVRSWDCSPDDGRLGFRDARFRTGGLAACRARATGYRLAGV